jgi:hypothetical protein
MFEKEQREMSLLFIFFEVSIFSKEVTNDG